MITERFAPSPSGLLHLGHAFSALTAFEAARAAGGTFLLRIEDIDAPRVSAKFEAQMLEDLHWLGLTWTRPILRQSDRLPVYRAALERLADNGLVFPCSCTRGDIARALSAPQEGDAQAQVYPGTCRGRRMESFQPGDAIRLNMAAAVAHTGPVEYTEIGSGHPLRVQPDPECLITQVGDVVLARKDIATSYHLAVVVDDAAQGVSHVTRGDDMIVLTPIHGVLQKLLAVPTPVYRHHRLIRDDNGKRLAKRHDALALKTLRNTGVTPSDIRKMVGLA